MTDRPAIRHSRAGGTALSLVTLFAGSALAHPLSSDGSAAIVPRDRLAELITAPALTPTTMLLALLVAAALGGLHALSPGHGKTVVGAYLVGSRGTARHALFLGLIVTITHTVGVFALGLVTLFASQYVLPERLFPVLSLASGGIVLIMGVTLLVARLRSALVGTMGADHHHGDHSHGEPHHHHGHTHHAHAPHEHDHDHGAQEHSHLPPDAPGGPLAWLNLLALGVSGGIVPCPSALVVLLSAIALHRIGFGLLLITAFSLGLAAVLTLIGLSFVYAGRVLQGRPRLDSLARVVPVISALIITVAGALICAEAVAQTGVDLFAPLTPARQSGLVASLSVLGLGLVFGLKHALDADHVAAVSTIVSERKSVLSSSLVGGLWGIGHTAALLAAAVVVIFLHVEISARVALVLELGVALMLISLGASALVKLVRARRIHLHPHRHGGRVHFHPHVHRGADVEDDHMHHDFRFAARPVLIGMVHGLAGSAALMLLVLSTIKSPVLALAYVAVFGLGSIGGMCAMSAVLGLPARLTARSFSRADVTVRTLAGLFSLSFGLFMAYEIGFVDGLFL